MLFFNTTTDKRYNERTLALYGFTAEDADVHPLEVNYPEVDGRFETYRDAQEVDVNEGVFSVRFEVVNLPHDRVLENIAPRYEQSVFVLRNAPITVGANEIQSPEGSIQTLTAWRSALENNIAFDPSTSPFIGVEPTVTVELIDEILTAIADHAAACDTLTEEVNTFLTNSTVDVLKVTDPDEWVAAQYVTITSA